MPAQIYRNLRRKKKYLFLYHTSIVTTKDCKKEAAFQGYAEKTLYILQYLKNSQLIYVFIYSSILVRKKLYILYIYIYIYIYTYIYIHIYVYTYVYTYIYIHIFSYISLYIYVYISIYNIYIYMYYTLYYTYMYSETSQQRTFQIVDMP